MNIKVKDFDDIEYLRRVVIHLYDLLDDIDTADDLAKGNDGLYRSLTQRRQAQKNDSGVHCPDGYDLYIERKKFFTNDEKKHS